MYIGIAGNIGSGKTTLTRIMTEAFGWSAHYEEDVENPFLSDFYSNMERWAFNIQVYFLTRRFKSVQKVLWAEENVVQDRTIYEDAYIFAENLFDMGIMQRRDYEAYMELFRVLNSFLRPPDLLIYLKATVPTLVKQITTRHRSYEMNINHDYLRQLNERYDKWVNEYRGEVIVIDVDNTDFANSEADRQKVIENVARSIESGYGTVR